MWCGTPLSQSEAQDRLFVALVVKLVKRVGGLFERLLQFIQLLGRVNFGLGLKLFHHLRSIVNVGREFLEFA